jgi:hypothetical protein
MCCRQHMYLFHLIQFLPDTEPNIYNLDFSNNNISLSLSYFGVKNTNKLRIEKANAIFGT